MLSLILDSLTFGLVIAFMAMGVIGIIVPVLPGTLLIWLAILVYVWSQGIAAVGVGAFIFLSLIALVTGTADLWLSLLGAKRGGASGRSLLFGGIGALAGTFFAPLIGTLIGYAAGILLSEYHTRRDWREAAKASLGGLAGWGLATAVQLGGGLLMLAIFIWRVLAAA